MHRNHHRESLRLVSARSPTGDLLGSTLQLHVGLHDCRFVSPGAKWSARFRLQIVNETSSIQLIHWFDTFQETPGYVRSWSAEIVSWEVTLPCVERWDINRHQNGTNG